MGVKNELQLHELNWRIDTKIMPDSQWRILIAMLWSFVIILIMVLANLVWWQWLLLIVITAMTVWLYRSNHISQRFPVVHITQPPFAQLYKSPWFVYVNNNDYDYGDECDDECDNDYDSYDGYDGYDCEESEQANRSSIQQSMQLWQGLLTATYAHRYLVVLHFDIIEPQPCTYAVSIWRDQVNDNAWRQLQVLARV